MSTLKQLADYVEKGKIEEISSLVQKLLGDNISADRIVSEGLVPGLDAIGEKYSKFECFCTRAHGCRHGSPGGP